MSDQRSMTKSYPNPTLPAVASGARLHADRETLLWCRAGAATVALAGGDVRLLPDEALWIAADEEHDVRTDAGSVVVPVGLPRGWGSRAGRWRLHDDLAPLTPLLNLTAMESMTLLRTNDTTPGRFHDRLAAGIAGRCLPDVLPGGASPWVDDQREHLLVWCLQGRARITVSPLGAGRLHTVRLGEHEAVVVPPGLSHRVDTEPGGVVLPLFHAPSAGEADADRVRVLHVTARLRAAMLFQVVADLGVLRAPGWCNVVPDVVAAASPVVVEPGEDEPAAVGWVRRIQLDLHLDRASGATLEGWANGLGVAPRSIERAFLAHAGMGFAQWRQRLRLQRAQSWLDEGLQAKWIAPRIGFAQVSGLSRAFQRGVGTSMRRYREEVSRNVVALR